jgi:Trk K+ transport system NAD-binding subunit/nucleotide-binding universal stress UspA family protein
VKILICGAGYIAQELLKRLGETWKVTLVDKDETILRDMSARFVSVVRVLGGDASSPVVLEKAGLGDQEYVLALTRDDASNLAVVTFAREKGIRNILSLVSDPEHLPDFEKLGVRTLTTATQAARRVHRYLLDPRVNVFPIGRDEAEFMEVDVGANPDLDGRRIEVEEDRSWRVVGILRNRRLIFPREDTVFRRGDRLLLLGGPDLYEEACSLLECSDGHFPRVYGHDLVLGMPSGAGGEGVTVLDEGLHLAQNVKVQRVLVVCGRDTCEQREQIERWARSLDIELRRAEEDVLQAVEEISKTESAGVVLLPPLPAPRIESLAKPVLIAMAHRLPCPLLVTRGTHPYENILVPYNGTKASNRSLEVAVDLATQLGGSVTVVVVEEPEYLHEEATDEASWLESTLGRVRERAHILKTKLHEEVRRGNPVKEITALGTDYNLIVLGSTTREKEFFSPHVGELLARKVPCSVLIVST